MDELLSPPQASTCAATLAALEEIRDHEELLVGSWRQLLDTTQRRLQELGDENPGHPSLRTARATAATAATEAAQAARFDARLRGLAADDLATARIQLEAEIELVQRARAEAVTHLRAAVDALLDGVAARIACDPRAAAAVGRYTTRLADDLVRAMRAYADRVEQILLDLGDAVRTACGLAMGGALPTRIPREAPRPEVDRIAADDATRLRRELADRAWRSVELYQERLDRNVDDAIRALRSRLDVAADQLRLGDDQRRERIRDLTRQAKRLDEMAESLDWMLPNDIQTPARYNAAAVSPFPAALGSRRSETA